MLRQSGSVVLLAVGLVVGACSGDDDGSTATTTSAAGIALPATPVGDQLEWFVTASATGTIAAADYEAHFTDSFRAQVSLESLVAPLAAGPFRVEEIRPGVTPHYLSVIADQAGTRYVLSAQVEPAVPGTPMRGLTRRPADEAVPDSPAGRPASWDALAARATALAPRAAMVVSEVNTTGRCGSVFRLAPDEIQPLASVMKLYVLGAVAEAVRAGRVGWGQQVPVDPALATLPAGVIQDEPAGTPVFVRDLAALMISISDNTATDHLMDLVGREAVEDQLARFAITDPFRNLPFITIDESFVLQLVDYPNLADQWRQADTTARRTLLASPAVAGADVTLADASGWTDARWEGIGWFASPADVCSALAGLHLLADDLTLADVDIALSAEDGGLGLAPDTWTKTWFKGGSEPGVFALAYLAEHRDGRVFVAVLLLADPVGALDAAALTPEALTLVRGAFDLAAGT